MRLRDDGLMHAYEHILFIKKNKRKGETTKISEQNYNKLTN